MQKSIGKLQRLHQEEEKMSMKMHCFLVSKIPFSLHSWLPGKSKISENLETETTFPFFSESWLLPSSPRGLQPHHSSLETVPLISSIRMSSC